MIQLMHGDCLELMKGIPDSSVDSIVTDPPYELGFMGKSWDSTGIAYSVPMWKECLRVLKPGGHLLSFGGSRTYHRMACAIEDAGFQIRDQIMWIYGSGFPKSMDVSKSIDKAAGVKRECTREGLVQRGGLGEDWDTGSSDTRPRYDNAVTLEAKQWDGWGTALKPAHEPIVLARKPLIGTVVANVLEHGTGALNIGASRIPGESVPINKLVNWSGFGEEKCPDYTATVNDSGRWPANLIHDGSDEVLVHFPDAKGQLADTSDGAPSSRTSNVYGKWNRKGEASADSDNTGSVGFKMKPGLRRLDSGSAARFFYCAKANKADREGGNTHPTVKPTELMRYLCRLVTPPNGTVLDPFLGSGSTGKAAITEGFNFIGIERDDAYFKICEQRIYDAELKVEADKIENLFGEVFA